VWPIFITHEKEVKSMYLCPSTSCIIQSAAESTTKGYGRKAEGESSKDAWDMASLALGPSGGPTKRGELDISLINSFV